MEIAMWTALLIALLACGDRDLEVEAATPAGEPAPVEIVEAAPAEEPAPVDEANTQPTVLDAAALYAECRGRVEGPEADGECTTDADCGLAGCGREVCLPAAQAAEVMTTCEVKPCFAVLEACGCHESRCTWTLKEAPVLPVKKLNVPAELLAE